MCAKGKQDAVRAVGGAPSKGKAESLTTKTVPVQRAAYKTEERVLRSGCLGITACRRTSRQRSWLC